jgi:hypothetical protein
MAILDNLKKGMELMVVFVGLFISFYALLFIGLLVIGVIANTVATGDINVSGTYDADITSNNDGIAGSMYDTETSFNSAISTLQNPVTIIISLVVVGILVAMFFPQGFTGRKTGSGGIL